MKFEKELLGNKLVCVSDSISNTIWYVHHHIDVLSFNIFKLVKKSEQVIVLVVDFDLFFNRKINCVIVVESEQY